MNRSRCKQLRNFIGEFKAAAERDPLHEGYPLEGMPVTLVREPGGRRDGCVIAVYDADNRKIGRLSRDVAHWLAPLLDSGVVAVDGMAPKRSEEADGSHFPIQIAAYAPRGAGKIFAPAGGRGRAQLVHAIIRQFYRKAQRETDPSAVAEMAAAVEPLARQDLMPETRMLIELLRGLGREIRMVRAVRAQSQFVLALGRVEVLEAVCLAGLDLFPLRWRQPQEVQLLPLRTAIDAGNAVISEVSADGKVPELKLKNRAKLPILVPEGEVIVGLKQNRVVNLSLIAPPNEQTIIPVSCVERGRWDGRHHRPVEFTVAPLAVRSVKLRSVRDQRRVSGGFQSNQMAVWESVGLLEEQTGIDSDTDSLADIRPNGDLSEQIESFRLPDAAAGLCVAANGQVLSVDLLVSPEHLRPRLGSMLQSYAIEAMRRRTNDWSRCTTSADAVRRFLHALAGAARTAPSAVALGDELEFPTDSVSGGALMYEGALAHLWAVSRQAE